MVKRRDVMVHGWSWPCPLMRSRYGGVRDRMRGVTCRAVHVEATPEWVWDRASRRLLMRQRSPAVLDL
jgi:hypothetical protein